VIGCEVMSPSIFGSRDKHRAPLCWIILTSTEVLGRHIDSWGLTEYAHPYPSFPRKRESRGAEISAPALDPRFRGGDEKGLVISGSFSVRHLVRMCCSKLSSKEYLEFSLPPDLLLLRM
jgi:hypothetical protein